MKRGKFKLSEVMMAYLSIINHSQIPLGPTYFSVINHSQIHLGKYSGIN